MNILMYAAIIIISFVPFGIIIKGHYERNLGLLIIGYSFILSAVVIIVYWWVGK